MLDGQAQSLTEIFGIDTVVVLSVLMLQHVLLDVHHFSVLHERPDRVPVSSNPLLFFLSPGHILP